MMMMVMVEMVVVQRVDEWRVLDLRRGSKIVLCAEVSRCHLVSVVGSQIMA